MIALSFLIWAAIAAGVTLLMGLSFNKKVPVGGAIGGFILFYLVAWLFLPPLAPDMLTTWMMFIVVTAYGAAITVIGSRQQSLAGVSIPALIMIAMVVGMFFTSGIFNAQKMADIITITDHGQKDSAIELASQEQARRVTPNLASKRAAELLGSAQQPGLGSIAEYGEMWGNVTPSGKAVWIAPLQPTGFFRWLSNSTTPGYFMASHTNVMDSKLVEDQPIAYGTSGFYFGNDLHRHLYINGYVNYSYGDAFFQINEQGVPHYVVPMERPQVGFWSGFPEKWAVVNATTGDIDEVTSSEELPSWVDRAFSQDVMRDRLEDWGCFSAGAWACYFSGVEVVDPTPGMVITMDSQNKMIYYTGTQFHNNKVEGATSGVATINARTGVVEYYRRSGITETAAVAIINGAVANYAGRDAESPVLVQINGRETYFAVITDASGAKKGFGMVWQRNRDVYGTGDNVQEAMRAYLRSAKNTKNMVALEGNRELEAIVYEGLVEIITPVIRGGETTFYVRIDSVDDKVFVVALENLAEIATTKVGEPVKLTSYNDEPGTVDADSFDNLVILLDESEAQKELSAKTSEVMQRYTAKVEKEDMTAKLRELNPEQVRTLLEGLEK